MNNDNKIKLLINDDNKMNYIDLYNFFKEIKIIYLNDIDDNMDDNLYYYYELIDNIDYYPIYFDNGINCLSLTIYLGNYVITDICNMEILFISNEIYITSNYETNYYKFKTFNELKKIILTNIFNNDEITDNCFKIYKLVTSIYNIDY